MLTLTDICAQFQTDIETFGQNDDDYGTQLRPLVLKLAKDAAGEVENYEYGEIPALLQRCYEVLAWLKAEAEDPEDRQLRYARQRAVLNLLTLCEGICRFHTGRRRAPDVAKLRDLVTEALRPLVEYAADNAEPPAVIIGDESLKKLARMVRSSSSG